jgi:hypothetical protein
MQVPKEARRPEDVRSVEVHDFQERRRNSSEWFENVDRYSAGAEQFFLDDDALAAIWYENHGCATPGYRLMNVGAG